MLDVNDLGASQPIAAQDLARNAAADTVTEIDGNQKKNRTVVLDVQTNCRPGPFFRHDDTGNC